MNLPKNSLTGLLLVTSLLMPISAETQTIHESIFLHEAMNFNEVESLAASESPEALSLVRAEALSFKGKSNLPYAAQFQSASAARSHLDSILQLHSDEQDPSAEFWQFMADDAVSQILAERMDFQHQQGSATYMMQPSRPSENNSGVMATIRSQPGYGFFASALIPGLGQVANQQYIKAGLMFATEIASIAIAVDSRNRGKRLEQRYIRRGDADWSVVKYANWVHNYYNNVPGARSTGSPPANYQEVLTPAGIAQINPATGYIDPVFDTRREWGWINLPQLRLLERRTRYLTTGAAFSHDVPNFGSQQYYELMSKYFQFGPGWRDWDPTLLNVNLTREVMTTMWQDHALLEARFNDSFRLSSNMVMLIMANHVFSAFDAYFTIKLRQHRLETAGIVNPSMTGMKMTWHF
jgi:hypothetical protein